MKHSSARGGKDPAARLAEAEEAVRRSERSYRALFMSLNEGFYASEVILNEAGRPCDYRYLEANPRFADLLGLSREQIIGLRYRELVPADATGWLDNYCRVAMTGESSRFGFYSPEYGRHFETYAYRPEPGLVNVFVFDDTERHRAEEALRTSEALLLNAAKIARLGYWEYDVVRDRFTFNDPFYAIFQTTAERIGGYVMSSARYAEQFVHPEDRELVGLETKKAVETTDPHFSRELEHRFLYADGSPGYLNVRFFIVKDAQGRTVKTYGVNQDVTERKLLEGRVSAELKEKSTLLQEIHHRVKNNMQIIVSLLSLQSAQIQDPEVRGKLKESQSRIYSMALVHEMLYSSESLARVDFRRYIEMLAERIWGLYPTQLPKEALELDVDALDLGIDDAVPCGLIVQELFVNALKYAFPAPVIGQPKIRVALKRVGEEIELTVADNGVGLAVDFDPGRTSSLGLKLVSILSQQLGGGLELDRRGGTAFHLRFRPRGSRPPED
jgi:two-component sensor histidine kinase/PAS domain-containing protein